MSTLAIAPEAPVSNRTKRQQALASPPRRLRPKRLQWTPMASIAAAVLVVLASVGIWRINTLPSDSLPPLAPQVAGIVSGDDISLQVATPAPKYACDFSQDIPIIPDVNEIPIDGTVLYISNRGSHSETPTGDLMLRCEGEPEDVVIASDVESVGPAEGMPGIVATYSPDDSMPETPTLTYINITTGDSFAAGSSNTHQATWDTYFSGSYLFVHDKDGLLVALDTRTMTATTIVELFGEGIPESFKLLHGSSRDKSTLALAVAEPLTDGGMDLSALRAVDTGAEGDILLLNSDTQEMSWLTIPGNDALIQDLIPSPDGSMIAVVLGNGDGTSSQSSVMVLSTADGEMLAESETFEGFDLKTIWSEAGLVIQAYSDLLLLPLDGKDTTVLYSVEGTNTLHGLKPTMNPNVVVVNSTICSGECNLADPETDAGVTSINVETGETIRFEGVNAAYLDWGSAITLLLMVDPTTTYPDPATYSAIDPVSGDIVAEFTDVPGIALVPRQRPIIGAQSISTSESGNVTVVSIGLTNMFELRSDGTTHSARMLPTPGNWDFGDSGWDLTGVVAVSPQGTTLFSAGQEDEGRNRYILDLTNSNAEWITVENTVVSSDRGFIQFVEGIPED